MVQTSIQQYKFKMALVVFCFLLGGCSGSTTNTSNTNLVLPPNPVPTADADQYGIFDYLVEQGYQGSALVFEKDAVLFSGGFGYADAVNGLGNTEYTVFRIGSVTKQFTAMAILILQERGFLSIDDLVSSHLSDYPSGDKISIKQLLNHTSGIANETKFLLH